MGRPDRTQEIVRSTLLGLYGPGPGGYPGNDDLGTMSAWWVLSALGIYPAIPGEDVLALTSPLFPRATLRLGGDQVVIAAPRSGRRPYVAGARLGAARHREPWARYDDLIAAGRLRFDLARQPTSWGSAKRFVPPSFGPNRPLRGC